MYLGINNHLSIIQTYRNMVYIDRDTTPFLKIC